MASNNQLAAAAAFRYSTGNSVMAVQSENSCNCITLLLIPRVSGQGKCKPSQRSGCSIVSGVLGNALLLNMTNSKWNFCVRSNNQRAASDGAMASANFISSVSCHATAK